jgi:hypothetical protein
MAKTTNTALNKVNNFFDTYARALENGDTKLMVNHYNLPCFLLSDESSNVYNDATKLEGLFNKAMIFYKKYGVAHVRPEVWSKRSWTDRIVKVRLNWQYYNADKQPIYNCDYQYILRLDKANNWKIESSVSINEMARIAAWEKAEGRYSTVI